MNNGMFYCILIGGSCVKLNGGSNFFGDKCLKDLSLNFSELFFLDFFLSFTRSEIFKS